MDISLPANPLLATMGAGSGFGPTPGTDPAEVNGMPAVLSVGFGSCGIGMPLAFPSAGPGPPLEAAVGSRTSGVAIIRDSAMAARIW